MAYLEFRDIKRIFPGKFTLDMSLQMDKGELLCIIGPSGSGKSTLLSILSGVDSPDEGRIVIDGTDITDLAIQKRRIGMVFQDFSLFSSMDVAKNIQYGMKEKFLPEERDYPCGGYTSRYFRGKVDYPFGYGLSYTTFAYSNPRFSAMHADANESVAVSVDVTNTGRRTGSEVVQVYVAYPRGKGLPAKEIKAFAKVDLAPGETKTATMKVDVSDCCFWDGTRRVVPNGDWRIEIAASARADGSAGFQCRDCFHRCR